MAIVKNPQIRAELARVGMSATRFAELMGVSKQEMSIMLNSVEWSPTERRNAIQLIRDNAEVM